MLIDASQNFAGVKPFPDPFYDYIAQTETGVAAFPSLGGDAILVLILPIFSSLQQNYFTVSHLIFKTVKI